MKSYLAIAILVFLSLIPPINFFLSNPSNDLWFVMILIACFFGLLTLQIKTVWPVRIVAVGSIFICFFGCAPYICFTSYVSIVLCCYFYILCSRITNWVMIFKCLQTLLWLNVLLMVLQFFGHDSLLNFGLGKDFTCFGAIGQHMQMGSYSVILSAILLSYNESNLWFPVGVAFFCTSAWTLVAVATGFFLNTVFQHRHTAYLVLVVFLITFIGYAGCHHKFSSNIDSEYGRLVIWKKSLALANQRWLTGWGPGTYKILSPALLTGKFIPYKAAHNWLVQLIFEMGYPFTFFVIGVLTNTFWRLYKAKEYTCMAGMAMMLIDMMVHFPDRMMQCVGLIILFLAYCGMKLRQRELTFGVVEKT